MPRCGRRPEAAKEPAYRAFPLLALGSRWAIAQLHLNLRGVHPVRADLRGHHRDSSAGARGRERYDWLSIQFVKRHVRRVLHDPRSWLFPAVPVRRPTTEFLDVHDLDFLSRPTGSTPASSSPRPSPSTSVLRCGLLSGPRKVDPRGPRVPNLSAPAILLSPNSWVTFMMSPAASTSPGALKGSSGPRQQLHLDAHHIHG